MTDTTPTDTPKTPSLRTGTPKEIAEAAMIRNEKRYCKDKFPEYLRSLQDDQSSIFNKKRPRQDTLNQQMDILDAMFTYLAVHADWKGENSHSYLMALRAQKQFCGTLKDLKNLKFPKAPESPPTSPRGQK